VGEILKSPKYQPEDALSILSHDSEGAMSQSQTSLHKVYWTSNGSPIPGTGFDVKVKKSTFAKGS